jgi:UrcA family protein
MINTITTAALAVVLVVTASPAAFATPPTEQVAFKVSTNGLDLRTRRDAQTMLRRIDIAANRACGGEPGIGDLTAVHVYKVCVTYNIGRAVNQLGSPMVAAANGQPMAAQTADSGH